MLYDRRDFGLLRLAGTYQWLPLAPLRALSSLKHLYREAELLSTLGLLSFFPQQSIPDALPGGLSILGLYGNRLPRPHQTPLRAKLRPTTAVRGGDRPAHLPGGRN